MEEKKHLQQNCSVWGTTSQKSLFYPEVLLGKNEQGEAVTLSRYVGRILVPIEEKDIDQILIDFHSL